MSEGNKNPQTFFSRNRDRLITATVCLLISAIFWVFNALNKDYNTSIVFPIKLEYDKSKYLITKPLSKSVKLAVSGYGWYLFSYSLGINQRPIKIIYDPNYDGVVNEDAIVEAAKSTYPNIKISQLVGEKLLFSVDTLSTKNIHLKLDEQKLNIPNGRKITSDISIEPAFFQCSGPKEEIQNLPDTVTFSLQDRVIESEFEDKIEINYHPSPSIKSKSIKVKVAFKVS